MCAQDERNERVEKIEKEKEKKRIRRRRQQRHTKTHIHQKTTTAATTVEIRKTQASKSNRSHVLKYILLHRLKQQHAQTHTHSATIYTMYNQQGNKNPK